MAEHWTGTFLHTLGSKTAFKPPDSQKASTVRSVSDFTQRGDDKHTWWPRKTICLHILTDWAETLTTLLRAGQCVDLVNTSIYFQKIRVVWIMTWNVTVHGNLMSVIAENLRRGESDFVNKNTFLPRRKPDLPVTSDPNWLQGFCRCATTLPQAAGINGFS